MPLKRTRADGVRVRDVSPERRMMLHVMRSRSESAIYHSVVYRIARTRLWLRRYNRAAPKSGAGAATLFHLFLWACALSLHRRPKMNRFVAGRRLYQREEVAISFAAKKSMDRDAPIVTVKVPFPDTEEPLPSVVGRITSSITEGRTSGRRTIDRELSLASRLPVFLVALVVWFYRVLDRMNLLPRRVIANDPMFASLFAANLGSVGLDDTAHHLYELGTVGIFAALGAPKKTLFVGRDGKPEVDDGLVVWWTLDERIVDGMTAGESLNHFRGIFEDPERHLGDPAKLAAGAGNARVGEAA